MNQTQDNAPAAPPGPSVRRKLIVTAVVAVAGFGIIFGVASLKKPPKPKLEQTAPPINVQVMSIQALAELNDTFLLPGVVEANRVVKVAAEVDGRVEKILAQEGHAVKIGQVLVQLKTDLLAAERDRAVAQDRFDTDDFHRISQLFDKKVIPEGDMEAARTKMQISAAALATANARLQRATIVAPIDGILNKMPVEEGEYLAPGTTAAQIVDIDTAKVVLQVPEKDVPTLAVGQKANVLIAQGKLGGTINYISELADDNTHCSRVEVSVDNHQRLLRTGRMVQAELSRGVLKNVIMVPLRAVIPLESGKEVFVAKDGKAVSCRIDIDQGCIKDDLVRVTGSSLQCGQMLIVTGHRYVSNGQAICIECVQPSAGRPASAPAAKEIIATSAPAAEITAIDPASGAKP